MSLPAKKHTADGNPFIGSPRTPLMVEGSDCAQIYGASLGQSVAGTALVTSLMLNKRMYGYVELSDRSVVPLNASITGYAMLLCPEHKYTSPKATFSNLMAADSAGKACNVRSSALVDPIVTVAFFHGVANGVETIALHDPFANDTALLWITVPIASAPACEFKVTFTVTFMPLGAHPHTRACPRWRTMLDAINDGTEIPSAFPAWDAYIISQHT